MSNFHATFKIKFTDLIYIYLETKITAKCQKKNNLKYFYSQVLSPLKYGMVTLEGAAHFFLGPVTENVVILCWDGQKEYKKKCPKNDMTKLHFRPPYSPLLDSYFVKKIGNVYMSAWCEQCFVSNHNWHVWLFLHSTGRSCKVQKHLSGLQVDCTGRGLPCPGQRMGPNSHRLLHAGSM